MARHVRASAGLHVCFRGMVGVQLRLVSGVDPKESLRSVRVVGDGQQVSSLGL